MFICYELTMTNVGSWNGEWSGEKSHIVVKSYRKKENIIRVKELIGNSFTYRWDDGWCVLITVTEVDSKQAGRLRRISSGFCGYNWMIDSIWKNGEIINE